MKCLEGLTLEMSAPHFLAMEPQIRLLAGTFGEDVWECLRKRGRNRDME